ncbi:MAG: hypothetical protein RL213_14 [Bacteroidota bacterium]|jgi:2-phosphosulfolactate phosphatase
MSSSAPFKIDACFSPALYPVYESPDTIVVIIDIFRATSAICTAFEWGADKVIPVATVEEARRWKEKGFLTGAERDAVQVDGFDFGNSPYHYMDDRIKGQTLVITTTNGTQAIEVSRNAYRVVIGSFLNIDALCSWLVRQERDILLLCSGWKNKFNLEDSLFAGAVTEELLLRSDRYHHGDGCLALKYLYQMAKQDPVKFLNYSYHKERLARLNLKRDIKYCLTPNQTDVIPVLEDGALVRMKQLVES